MPRNSLDDLIGELFGFVAGVVREVATRQLAQAQAETRKVKAKRVPQPKAPRAPKARKSERERVGPTLYETLGVDRKASATVIEAAWKAQARDLHPDRNKSADAARRMAAVNNAHDVLGDAAKRREYDRGLK